MWNQLVTPPIDERGVMDRGEGTSDEEDNGGSGCLSQL